MECCRVAFTQCDGGMAAGQCGCPIAPQPRVATSSPETFVFVSTASPTRTLVVEAAPSFVYYRRPFNWSGEVIPTSTRAGPDIGRAPPLS